MRDFRKGLKSDEPEHEVSKQMNKREKRALPNWFAPLEKGLRSFFILCGIGSSIYVLCTVQNYWLDIETRLKHPDWEFTQDRIITEMDYVWIIGLGILFLLTLLALAFCRYILRRGYLVHIAACVSLLFWVLDTVHPFLLTYTEEPFIREGTESFILPLHIISHILPGALFGCALVLWSIGLLYCVERIAQKIFRIEQPAF